MPHVTQAAELSLQIRTHRWARMVSKREKGMINPGPRNPVKLGVSLKLRPCISLTQIGVTGDWYVLCRVSRYRYNVLGTCLFFSSIETLHPAHAH
jgi:hypothetical protein